MSCDIVLMSRKAYPAIYVTNRREIEAQVTNEMNHALGKLISDNRFIYNAEQKSITLRSMLVSQSNTPQCPVDGHRRPDILEQPDAQAAGRDQIPQAGRNDRRIPLRCRGCEVHHRNHTPNRR